VKAAHTSAGVAKRAGEIRPHHTVAPCHNSITMTTANANQPNWAVRPERAAGCAKAVSMLRGGEWVDF